MFTQYYVILWTYAIILNNLSAILSFESLIKLAINFTIFHFMDHDNHRYDDR